LHVGPWRIHRGSTIHEHFHAEEEVYEVMPSNARHSVKALSDGRVIIVDHPARPDFG
jgi:hypothetical protein